MADPILTPAVHEAIADLADKHEESKANIAENKATIGNVAAQVNNWSSFFSTPVGKVIGGLIVAYLVTWISGKLPAPVAEVLKSVVGVNQPEVKPEPIREPVVGPSVEPVTVKTSTVMIYRTAKTDPLELSRPKLPVGVYVNPKVYAEGLVHPVSGTKVPYMELIDPQGKVLDVAPFVNAEGAAVFLKGK